MSKTEKQSEFLEATHLYFDRMFDCVAFDSQGECVSEEGEENLHPVSYCLHPENGGPKHGCDLFDINGRLISNKTCLYRVRGGGPGANELKKIANWDFIDEG